MERCLCPIHRGRTLGGTLGRCTARLSTCVEKNIAAVCKYINNKLDIYYASKKSQQKIIFKLALINHRLKPVLVFVFVI